MAGRLKKAQGQGDHRRSRRQSIRFKITVLILVPLLSLIGLWGYAVSLTIQDTLAVNLLAEVEAAVHAQTGKVLDALQQERRTSTVYIGSGRSASAGTTLEQRRQQTDKEAAAFRTLVDEEVLADVNPQEREWLGEMRKRLATLDSLRDEVDGGSMRRASAELRYTEIIKSCLGVFTMMTTDKNPHYGFYHQTMVSLQTAREVLSQEDALLAGVLAAGTITSGEFDTFAQRVGAYRALFADAESSIADSEIRSRFWQVVDTEAFSKLQDLEGAVLQKGRGQRELPFSLRTWDAAQSQVTSSLQNLEGFVYESLVGHAKPVVMEIIAHLVVMLLLGLVIVILSIYLTLRIGRVLIRQLNELKQTLFELAEERLPRVVEKLREGKQVDVASEAPPLAFGPDELGDVSRAFNVVQQTAIQTAVEQAELRRGVRDVFLSLARRTQVLVHRQLNLLDAMERRESEPEELDDLFRIDHLATRMRRNAENLIVLSGATPGRAWRNPVPLVNVVRGAVAEVEDYARVKLLPIGSAKLSGQAVGDVIHLLAELIENATSFSPPETVVQVGGQPVANGFAVEIEDRGLGMTDADLAAANEQISNPPEFNLSRTARLGLYVVAHLADRHGVQVQLRSSPYGGTTAIVLIPRDLVVTDGDDDGQQGLPGADVPAIAAKNGAASLPHRGVDLRQMVELSEFAGAETRNGSMPGNAAQVSGQAVRAQPWPRPPQPIGRHMNPPMPPVEETGPDPQPAPPPEPELNRRTGAANGRPSPAAAGDNGVPELPQRVRQSHLAAQLRETDTGSNTASAPARPPEEVRRMMSSYQQGTTQGRRDASWSNTASQASSGPAGVMPEDGAEPSGYGGPHDELPR